MAGVTDEIWICTRNDRRFVAPGRVLYCAITERHSRATVARRGSSPTGSWRRHFRHGRSGREVVPPRRADPLERRTRTRDRRDVPRL
jgi:hypothetical protein